MQYEWIKNLMDRIEIIGFPNSIRNQIEKNCGLS